VQLRSLSVSIHRSLIVASYFLTWATVYAISHNEIFGSPLVAALGISSSVCAIVSPYMVMASMSTLQQKASLANAAFFLLSIIYEFALIAVIYTLWPKLMGI
jgi:hypothetical protein